MPLFKSRKQQEPESMYIGKKLHSDLSTDECIAHLRAGLAAYDLPNADEFMFEAQWAGTARLDPDVVFGIWFEPPRPSPRNALYLAIWSHGGYHEGTYQEMALVPPERDSDVPTPYIGHWAQRDGSLKTIGVVPSETFKVIAPSEE